MLRNLAIYKDDGRPWTQEEYDIISNMCEDGHPANLWEIEPDDANKKYIFDDGDTSKFMHMWAYQSKVKNFSNCTQISYTEFLIKYAVNQYSVPQVQFSFMKDKET